MSGFFVALYENISLLILPSETGMNLAELCYIRLRIDSPDFLDIVQNNYHD